MARKGILGTKLGMTQVFDENNRVVPVTVVKAGPNENGLKTNPEGPSVMVATWLT